MGWREDRHASNDERILSCFTSNFAGVAIRDLPGPLVAAAGLKPCDCISQGLVEYLKNGRKPGRVRASGSLEVRAGVQQHGVVSTGNQARLFDAGLRFVGCPSRLTARRIRLITKDIARILPTLAILSLPVV